MSDHEDSNHDESENEEEEKYTFKSSLSEVRIINQQEREAAL